MIFSSYYEMIYPRLISSMKWKYDYAFFEKKQIEKLKKSAYTAKLVKSPRVCLNGIVNKMTSCPNIIFLTLKC